MERGWKKFGDHDRKNLDCLEHSTNMDDNKSVCKKAKGNKRMVEKKHVLCLREYLNYHEQTVHNEGVSITSLYACQTWEITIIYTLYIFLLILSKNY